MVSASRTRHDENACVVVTERGEERIKKRLAQVV